MREREAAQWLWRLVLFVGSEESSFSTGYEFIVDRGFLLGPVPQQERVEAAVA